MNISGAADRPEFLALPAFFSFPPCVGTFLGAVLIELEPLLVNASSSHTRNRRVCSAQSPEVRPGSWAKSPTASIRLIPAVEVTLLYFSLLECLILVLHYICLTAVVTLVTQSIPFLSTSSSSSSYFC